jgi:chaperonin GroEL (HSP60 family)
LDFVLEFLVEEEVVEGGGTTLVRVEVDLENFTRARVVDDAIAFATEVEGDGGH